MTESEISCHTLILRGIDRTIPKMEAIKKISDIFSSLIENDLIGVHVLGDYQHLTSMLKKLERCEKKKEHYQAKKDAGEVLKMKRYKDPEE